LPVETAIIARTLIQNHFDDIRTEHTKAPDFTWNAIFGNEELCRNPEFHRILHVIQSKCQQTAIIHEHGQNVFDTNKQLDSPSTTKTVEEMDTPHRRPLPHATSHPMSGRPTSTIGTGNKTYFALRNPITNKQHRIPTSYDESITDDIRCLLQPNIFAVCTADVSRPNFNWHAIVPFLDCLPIPTTDFDGIAQSVRASFQRSLDSTTQASTTACTTPLHPKNISLFIHISDPQHKQRVRLKTVAKPETIHIKHTLQQHFDLILAAPPSISGCSWSEMLPNTTGDIIYDSEFQRLASKLRDIVNKTARQRPTSSRQESPDPNQPDSPLLHEPAEDTITLSTSVQISAGIAKFKDRAAETPSYVCCVCEQTWFRQGIRDYRVCNYPQTMQDFLPELNCNNSYICHTCHASFKNNRVPDCSTSNLRFPVLPPELRNLNEMETLLICPRIPFMTLRNLPTGRQRALKGCIVNIPANNDLIQTALPRPADRLGLIPIIVKRKLQYRKPYLSSLINPDKVLAALQYLVHTSPLWQQARVRIVGDSSAITTSLNDFEKAFITQHNTVEDQLTHKEAQLHKKQKLAFPDLQPQKQTSSGHLQRDNSPPMQPCLIKDQHNHEQSDCEDEEPSDMDEDLPGDTFLHPLMDSTMIWDTAREIHIAPAEANHPLGMLQDEHSEALSFPDIYGGLPVPQYKNEQTQKPISKATIVRWMFRNNDNRAARSPTFLFYCFRRLQILQILRSAHVKLRQPLTYNQKLTAKDVKTPDQQNALSHSPVAFRDFQGIRTSPGFWDCKKNQVFSMIRQLGPPTFFLTLSAADMKWPDFIQNLQKAATDPLLRMTRTEDLTFTDKAHLIRDNPVLAARLTRNRIESFFTEVLLKTAILTEIVDYFARDEFQHRGSPHSHSLLWTRNTLVWEPHKNDEDICKFVDSFITCSASAVDADLIPFQTHHHRRCLRRHGKTKVCKHNFPLPPMTHTTIIYPYNTEPPAEIQQNWKHIRERLNALPRTTTITIADFLKDLNMTPETYLAAIRHGFKRPTVLLQRAPNEIWINNYTPTILQTWRANMDIQFCLDPYATATYIASYMLKHMKGLSTAMAEACRQTIRGNYSVRDSTRHVSNIFINGQESAAQECVYAILSMPFTQSSRAHIYINATLPSKRQLILKKPSQLQALADDDPDIIEIGIIPQYAQRTSLCIIDMSDVHNIQDLESMTLATFAACYERIFRIMQCAVPKTMLKIQHTLPQNVFV
jgi:Helitron helicase-like domain at N-terminus